MDFTKLYINGQWVEPKSNEYIEVENPATKEIFERVPRSNEEDVNLAVASAKEAFQTWQYSPLEERIQYMSNFIEELNKNLEVMTEIIVKELGSSYWFAKEKHLIPYFEDIQNYMEIVSQYEFEEKIDHYIVRREPVGVVAAITPWNYPFGQITKKIVPALLAGNTAVLKPSQNTPLVAYYLTQAIHDAGFPKGVFNLVTGRGGEVGNVLSNHKDVQLISFTGSTYGGKEVAKAALDDVKNVTLELGGKSPSIVLKGADLELAVKETFNSLYVNTGQSCSALSRLLVPREYKENIERILIEKTKEYHFGDPSDKNNLVGPLASKKQFEKVSYFIQRGVEEGAKLLIGEIPKKNQKGYYVGPTIFTEVDNAMEIAQDEIFGPVLCVIYYDNEEQAIEIANETVYGLSGAVFGPKDHAHEIARKIKTGTVMVNGGLRTHAAPFGGYKHSGIGREGGRFGLEEYLEIKTIF